MALPNPPSVVQVTVEAGPRGRRDAGPVRLRALIAVSLIGAGLAAVLIAGGVGGGAASHPGRTAGVTVPISDPTPRLRGVAQVAEVTEADRFPLGCMGIALTRGALAGALRSRTGPCWHYGAFVTAILRRVDGVWRLALAARSRSCPPLALPAEVRAQVAVCRR